MRKEKEEVERDQRMTRFERLLHEALFSVEIKVQSCLLPGLYSFM